MCNLYGKETLWGLLGLSMARYEPLCFHLQSFFERTLNGQLEDPGEQVAEFDKKCIGLEKQTVPLKHQSAVLV